MECLRYTAIINDNQEHGATNSVYDKEGQKIQVFRKADDENDVIAMIEAPWEPTERINFIKKSKLYWLSHLFAPVNNTGTGKQCGIWET